MGLGILLTGINEVCYFIQVNSGAWRRSDYDNYNTLPSVQVSAHNINTVVRVVTAVPISQLFHSVNISDHYDWRDTQLYTNS